MRHRCRGHHDGRNQRCGGNDDSTGDGSVRTHGLALGERPHTGVQHRCVGAAVAQHVERHCGGAKVAGAACGGERIGNAARCGKGDGPAEPPNGLRAHRVGEQHDHEQEQHHRAKRFVTVVDQGLPCAAVELVHARLHQQNPTEQPAAEGHDSCVGENSPKVAAAAIAGDDGNRSHHEQGADQHCDFGGDACGCITARFGTHEDGGGIGDSDKRHRPKQCGVDVALAERGVGNRNDLNRNRHIGHQLQVERVAEERQERGARRQCRKPPRFRLESLRLAHVALTGLLAALLLHC